MARTKGSNAQRKEVIKSPTGRVSPVARPPIRQNPKRFRPKVRKDFVPSGSRKKETDNLKTASTVKGKDKMGKRPRTPSPTISLVGSESESDSDEAEIVRALDLVEKIQPTPKKQRTGKPSSVPSPDSLPFLDGNLDADVNQQKYEKYFREKPFCPVVSVNFEAVKNDSELRLDLSEILGHYECWLKIDEEFSPEVVRKFYCNMTETASNDDTEVIRTRLRGREIVLTSARLNELLGAPPISSEPLQPLSAAEA